MMMMIGVEPTQWKKRWESIIKEDNAIICTCLWTTHHFIITHTTIINIFIINIIIIYSSTNSNLSMFTPLSDELLLNRCQEAENCGYVDKEHHIYV